jgi:hypothetical protein
MKRALPLLLLLLLGLCFCEAASAQELGRLFFTPEQRRALDARRSARVPDRPAAAVVASPTLRLDGYVKRSGGKSTVWINGEPADDTVRLPSASESTVTLGIGDTGARVRMKPGQSLDRGNGEVRDGIGDGEIRIRRAPAR